MRLIPLHFNHNLPLGNHPKNRSTYMNKNNSNLYYQQYKAIIGSFSPRKYTPNYSFIPLFSRSTKILYSTHYFILSSRSQHQSRARNPRNIDYSYLDNLPNHTCTNCSPFPFISRNRIFNVWTNNLSSSSFRLHPSKCYILFRLRTTTSLSFTTLIYP